MESLGHWDYVETLGDVQIAHLVLGIDPTGMSTVDQRAALVLDRIRSDAATGRHNAWLTCTGYSFDDDADPLPEAGIESLQVKQALAWYHEGRETDAMSAIERYLKEPIEYALFGRGEIAEWLARNKLKSVYEFMPTVPGQQGKRHSTGDVGTKERNTLLTIIGVLCEQAKLDITHHSKAAGVIAAWGASSGISIGETTVEEHLKKARAAMDTKRR